MKKVLITSGAMKEPLDDIRVITNISSGTLGTIIANIFAYNNFKVTYLHTRGSVIPDLDKNITCIEKSSYKEVEEVLKVLIPKNNIIIHAMAVSDFSFEQKDNIKIHSPEQLVSFVKDNIKVNPKLLAQFRELNPNAFIVGFKFESGINHDILITKARNQNKRYNLNYTLANDKKEMIDANNHIAYLVNENSETKCTDKLDIARKLVEIAKKQNKLPDMDAFLKKYTPDDTLISTDFNVEDGQEGMLETYGIDLQLVLDINKVSPRKIWTACDYDNKLVLLNGYHLVNRVYYVVTKQDGDENEEYELR